MHATNYGDSITATIVDAIDIPANNEAVVVPVADSVANGFDAADRVDSFYLYYQNAGGLRTKTNEFYSAAADSSYAIIALTETWLPEDIHSAELFNDRYHVYRKDRSIEVSGLSRGGGVLLAIRSNLISRRISLENSSLEQLCVQVILPISLFSIYVFVSYIPPDSNNSIYAAHTQNIFNIVNSLNSKSHVVVVGDFNLGDIKWVYSEEDKYLYPCNALKDIEYETVDSFFSMNCRQVNNVLNSNNRILDLVFITNELEAELNVVDFPFVNNSIHHKALCVEFKLLEFDKLNFNLNRPRSLEYDFSKADYIALNSYFNELNFDELLDSNNLNRSYETFMNILEEAYAKFVPLKKVILGRKPVWFNRHLSCLKNKMIKLQKKSKFNSVFRDKYVSCRREYEALNRFLYRNYLWSVESRVKKDSKAFWSYLNSKRQSFGLPVNMFFNDATSSDESEICNMFASFFQSNFVSESIDSLLTFDDGIDTISDIGSLVLTEKEVELELSGLKANKKVAPDNVAPIFLKMCKTTLAYPLVKIFNLSLQKGEFLDTWKFSFVTPIYKSGSKQDVTNYRPISKLQIIPKVFEALVKKRMFDAVRQGISENQHGFVSGRSTTTNLTLFSNFCIKGIERGNQVDAVYTDFSKAFDRVQHNILVKKLELMGFHSNFLKWIHNYLIGRIQYVKIGSSLSSVIKNNSGVPQGSHLGPLLFILFINDLPARIKHSDCLLYADDLKLFKSIKSIEDCTRLQNDIDTVSKWCIENVLYLNVSKCKIISFTRSLDPLLYHYNILNETLMRVEYQKDLGVVFDTKLKFNLHYDYIISKANSLLGFIKRNSKEFHDPYTLKSLYVSLIRSILEYACCIWCPSYANSINRIESVQRKFTRYAIRKLNWTDNIMPPYDVRCTLIDLKPLHSRRKYYLIMLARDALLNYIDCPALLALYSIYAPSRPLRQRQFFFVPRHFTNYGLNDPVSNSSSMFNSVCDVVDLNLSRQAFKNIITNLI